MGRETSQVPAETRARDKFSLAPARASFQVPVLAARVSRFLRAAPAPCPLVRCRASRSLPKSAVSVQSQSTHLPLTDHPSWSLSGHFSYSNIKKQGGRSTHPETERRFCISSSCLSSSFVLRVYDPAYAHRPILAANGPPRRLIFCGSCCCNCDTAETRACSRPRARPPWIGIWIWI